RRSRIRDPTIRLACLVFVEDRTAFAIASVADQSHRFGVTRALELWVDFQSSFGVTHSLRITAQREVHLRESIMSSGVASIGGNHTPVFRRSFLIFVPAQIQSAQEKPRTRAVGVVLQRRFKGCKGFVKADEEEIHLRDRCVDKAALPALSRGVGADADAGGMF